MRWPVLVLVGIAIAGTGALAFWKFAPVSGEALLAQDCEAVLFERLKAPATYSRIAVSKALRSKTSLEEFLDIDNPEKMKRAMAAQATSSESRSALEALKQVYAADEYETVKLVLTYDAANSYGTPMRGEALCSQIVRSGDTIKGGALSGTRVDGYDRVSWATYQLWKLSQ